MQTPTVIIPLDHTTVPVTLVILEMEKRVQVNEDHVYCQLNFIADSVLYYCYYYYYYYCYITYLSNYIKCLHTRMELNRSSARKVIFDFLFLSNSKILLP